MLAITLYVPDATAKELTEDGTLLRVILDGVPELDFLRPGWWEHSHTVRFGVAFSAPEPGPVTMSCHG